MRVMMWFRADLRTGDNPALHAATTRADRGVVAVFAICPRQWLEHDWAGVKVEFLLRHLKELRESLAKLNIPLAIMEVPRFADVPARLLELARKYECDAIYFNDEYEVNEVRRDQAARAMFEARGLHVESFTDQCLLKPGSVRTGDGRFFTVFTPFRKALYRQLNESGGVRAVPAARKQAEMIELARADAEVPPHVEGFSTEVPASLWPAGEREAMRRLRAFVAERILSYKSERDFPALDSTSTLSPYLAAGSISHRQCVAAAMEANEGKLESRREGPTHWISEVAWREFYRHILVGFPRVSMNRAFKPATENLRWSNDRSQFAAWQAGRTGIPIVDAGMRQLRQTGWMHNRVRMIVAMFLTKDLLIDWRWGERHFMRHLIDGDLASNNGGWQWSASTGTDAAPYFRIFNPITQSRRFDPDGEYIRRWVPELSELEGGEDGPIHDPSELPALLRGSLDYPEPIVDRAMARERVMEAFRRLG